MVIEHSMIPPIQVPNMVPFTHKDGAYYIEILKSLVKYLDTVVDKVNEVNTELAANIDAAIEELRQFTISAVDSLEGRVDVKIAELVEYVNDAIQKIIGNSIDVQDVVVAELVKDIDSATGKAINELLKLKSNRYPLSLKDCGVKYLGSYGLIDRYVTQQVFICNGDNGRAYIGGNRVGTLTGRETIHIKRVNVSGSGYEEMVFVDGGHGDAFFVEYEDGVPYLWTFIYDMRQGANTPERFNYIRMPWLPGVYEYADVEQYRVASISGVGHRASYDQYNGLVSLRRGGGTSRSVEVHRLSDIKANTMGDPVAMGNLYINPEYGSMQDHCYVYETGLWYVTQGDSSGKRAIIEQTGAGAVRAIHELTGVIDVDMFGVDIPFAEPQGLHIHHDASGNPSVLFSVARFATHARKTALYGVSMGAIDGVRTSPLPDDLTEWTPVGIGTALVITDGYTSNASQPLMIRLCEGHLEFVGRIDGDFPVGPAHNLTIAKIHPTFRVLTNRNAVAELNGAGGAVRVELPVSGNVNVYFPELTTARTSLTFDNIRVPLRNV